MNKLLIIIFLFVPTLGMTTQYDINIFVKKVEEEYLMNDQLNVCMIEDMNRSLIRECMQDLCGSANIENSIVLTQDQFDRVTNKSIKDEFKDDSQKIVEQLETQYQFATKLSEELIQRKDKLEFSEQEASVILFKLLLPYLDIISNSETGEISIDLDDKVYNLNNQGKDAIKKYLGNVKSKAEEDWETAYQLGIPLEKDLLIKELTSLQKIIEEKLNNDTPEQKAKNEKLLEAYKHISSIRSTIRFPMPGEDVTNKDYYYLANQMINLKNFVYAELQLKNTKNFCKGLDCQKIIQEHFSKDLNGDIMRFKTALEDYGKKPFKDQARKCKHLYYLDKLEARSRGNELAVINQEFTKAVQFMKDKYSDESADFLDKFLMTRLNKSTTEKNIQGLGYVDAFKQLGQQETEYKQKEISNIKTKSDYDLVSELLGHFKNTFPIYSHQLATCAWGDDENLYPIVDYYYADMNFLKLSQFSCNHDIGHEPGIVLHELGHVISDLIAKKTASKETTKKYLKERECVNSQEFYPIENITNQRKVHAGDHYRSEEDMADFFSAQAANYFHIEGMERTITSCNTLPIINSEYDVENLEGFYWNKHSSPAMRVLREAHYKKIPLPVSCNEVLVVNEHMFDFKECSK